MARYLEYEINSGRIISEIISAAEPTPAEGYGLYPIPDDAELDTTLYKVLNGVLVKQYETNEERLERAIRKKEQGENVRLRLQSIVYEVIFAILEDDKAAMQELREEYKRLKACM